MSRGQLLGKVGGFVAIVIAGFFLLRGMQFFVLPLFTEDYSSASDWFAAFLMILVGLVLFIEPISVIIDRFARRKTDQTP